MYHFIAFWDPLHIMTSSLSFAAFKILFCVFGFFIVHLDLGLFRFILLGIGWTWIQRSLSFFKFEKYSGIISWNNLSSLFSLSSSGTVIHIFPFDGISRWYIHIFIDGIIINPFDSIHFPSFFSSWSSDSVISNDLSSRLLMLLLWLLLNPFSEFINSYILLSPPEFFLAPFYTISLCWYSCFACMLFSWFPLVLCPSFPLAFLHI